MDSTKSGRITEPEFVEWWNGKGDSFHKQLHDSLKAPLHAPWPVRDGLLTYDLPRSFASPNRWIQPKCRRSSRAHEHRDGESSARRACSPGSLRGSTRRESRYIYSCLIACRPVSCRTPSAARYPLSAKVTPLFSYSTISTILKDAGTTLTLLIASLRYRLRCHLHCLRCDVAEALRAGDESQVGAEAGVI